MSQSQEQTSGASTVSSIPSAHSTEFLPSREPRLCRSHSSQGPPGSEGKRLTPGHVDSGKPTVQGLLPGVWVEATLGEVDMDIDGAILLYTLQKKVARGWETERQGCSSPAYSSFHLLPTLQEYIS